MRALAEAFFRRPYLLLIVTALAWAGNAIAGRLARDEVSPMVLTCLRWVLACAILVPLARRDVLLAWPELVPRWRYILVMAALGFTAFNGLFYAAATYTTALNIMILQGAMPVIVLIGSFLAYRIPVRGMQAVGTAITLFGVGVVATQGSLAHLRDLALNLGDVLMLGAALFYAGYIVGLRARPPVPGLALFAAFAAFAFATSIPLLAIEIARGTVQWPTPFGWAILVYVAAFPSVMGQLFFMRAVDLIGPGRAGIFMNLVPILGALLSVLVLGEAIHPYHVAALALVLGGIALAEKGRS